jgi:hypothetical protein
MPATGVRRDKAALFLWVTTRANHRSSTQMLKSSSTRILERHIARHSTVMQRFERHELWSCCTRIFVATPDSTHAGQSKKAD